MYEFIAAVFSSGSSYYSKTVKHIFVSMKNTIIASLLFLIPLFSAAKGNDWKRYCITELGDTILVTDSIKMTTLPGADISDYITPTEGVYEGSDHGNMTIVNWNMYQNHLALMVGGTFPITRLSRAKNDAGEYRPLIVITDPNADFDRKIGYVVAIDRAIRDNIVEIVKKQ